jgi:hypothetical protein
MGVKSYGTPAKADPGSLVQARMAARLQKHSNCCDLREVESECNNGKPLAAYS